MYELLEVLFYLGNTRHDMTPRHIRILMLVLEICSALVPARGENFRPRGAGAGYRRRRAAAWPRIDIHAGRYPLLVHASLSGARRAICW
eukprot:SAG31_NODE_3579_length_4102_cov_3.565326_2_plen_89_part_00